MTALCDHHSMRALGPWRSALVMRVTAGLHAAATGQTGARPVLALSGGRTPRDYLPTLFRAPLDWPGVTLTLADDRLVPRCHPASNLGLVSRALQPMRPALRPRLIPLTDGAAPMPDVVVLGMGEDGHTASLFPNLARAPGPNSLTETVRRPGDPYDRITLTEAALAAASTVILMISGAKKVSLWERIRDDRADVRDLPVARLLRGRRGTGHTVALVLD